jgi:hypothetical protein
VPGANGSPSDKRSSSSGINQPSSTGSTPAIRQPPAPAPPGVGVQTITNTTAETQPPRVASGPAEKSGSNPEPGFSLFPAWFSAILLDLLEKGLWAFYLLMLLIVGTALFLRLRSAAQKRPLSRTEVDSEDEA